MQPHARLIQHKQSVHKPGAQAGGQVHPFGLTAGKGPRGPVQRQITQPHILQIPEARPHLIQSQAHRIPARCRNSRYRRDKSRRVPDRQFVKIGQGQRVDKRIRQTPAGFQERNPEPFRNRGPVKQGLRLEPRGTAAGTGGVGPVAGEHHPHMHLVGLGLQPAEVALHPIPRPGPLMLIILPVAGFPLNHQLLIPLRQAVKRDIRGNLHLAAHPHQVGLALGPLAGEPRFHNPLGKRPRPVRHRQVVIDADDPPEPLALGTGPDRVVEAEQGRAGLRIFNIASRTVQPLRKPARLPRLVPRARNPQRQPPLAKMIRLLAGLHKPRPVCRCDPQPVLDHRQNRRQRPGLLADILNPLHPPAPHEPLIPLLPDQLKRFLQRKPVGTGHIKGDQHLAAPVDLLRRLPHLLRRILPHHPAATLAVQHRDMRPEHLHEIADLRHCPHGGTCGLHRVLLLDRHRRGDPLDTVHLRLVHPVQKLPGIGREGLDVAPLPLRKQGVKGQGTLAGPAQSRQDNEPVQRQFQVKILKVVMADSPKTYRGPRRRNQHARTR